MTTSEHESPAVSDLTPRERAAQRLLALRALETLLKETSARIRAEDGAAFNKAGQREVAELPDGTPLGNVRADPGKAAGWAVVDEPKFRAWVEAYVPDAIVEQVVTTRTIDPAYVAAVLEAQTTEGWIEPATGEEFDFCPPGVEFRKAGPPILKVTGDKAAPAAVARRLGDTLQTMLGIES